MLRVAWFSLGYEIYLREAATTRIRNPATARTMPSFTSTPAAMSEIDSGSFSMPMPMTGPCDGLRRSGWNWLVRVVGVQIRR